MIKAVYSIPSRLGEKPKVQSPAVMLVGENRSHDHPTLHPSIHPCYYASNNKKREREKEKKKTLSIHIRIRCEPVLYDSPDRSSPRGIIDIFFPVHPLDPIVLSGKRITLDVFHDR